MAKSDVDPNKVKQCLTGVSYPASKEELIRHVQSTCGDQEVVSMLKDLPEQSYGQVSDLKQVLGGLGIHLRLDI